MGTVRRIVIVVGSCAAAAVLAGCGGPSSGRAGHLSSGAARPVERIRDVIRAEKLQRTVYPDEIDAARDSRVLAVEIPRDTTVPETVLATWDGILDALSLRVRAAATGARPVVGVGFWFRGGEEPTGLVSNSLTGRHPPVRPQGERAARRHVGRAARRLGVTVRSISFERRPALGPFPVVYLSIPGEARAWLNAHPYAGAQLGLGGEGWFVAVFDDSTRRPIAVEGTVARLETSISWLDPKLHPRDALGGAL